MNEPSRISIEEGAGTPAGQGLAIIIDDDLTIQQDSGFTVVLGFTVVRNPSRVPSRWAKLAVNGTAFDYKGAVGLTQSLALATGGAVYLTQTDQEGEHYIYAAPDHLCWQRPRKRAMHVACLPWVTWIGVWKCCVGGTRQFLTIKTQGCPIVQVLYGLQKKVPATAASLNSGHTFFSFAAMKQMDLRWLNDVGNVAGKL